ncbi:unnamed protein product [Musa acuminata subsp. burmannicoides]
MRSRPIPSTEAVGDRTHRGPPTRASPSELPAESSPNPLPPTRRNPRLTSLRPTFRSASPRLNLDRLRLIRRLLRLTAVRRLQARVLRSVPDKSGSVLFSVGLDRFHHALGRMAFVDADKLSYEIFSVLEQVPLRPRRPQQALLPTSSYSSAGASPRTAAGARGRIRILSIDGGGSPSDALLAAVALARLESSLRHRSGDPSARVAYMFDVAAGSGAGGVLVAMLFTRDHDGRPLFSATDALHLLLSESRRRGRGFSSGGPIPWDVPSTREFLPSDLRRRDAEGHRQAGAHPVLRPRHGGTVPLLAG